MRTSKIIRKTKETDIVLELNLDGKGINDINTNIGFFDHMLTQISVHGLIDLKIKAIGDLNIDQHHTVEDVGICLGQAIKEAIGDKQGINRYGSKVIPMDEALVLCSIDICNRPYSCISTPFKMEKQGDFETDLVSEFFNAVALNSGLNIQSIVYRGSNTHHIIEATFKAFARALLEAITINPRFSDVVSSKGVL